MIQRREFLKLASGAVTGCLFFTPLAVQAATKAAERSKVLGQEDITLIEQTITVPEHPQVTIQTVELPPGGVAAPHRHPGPVFGYVLEGEVVIQMEGQNPSSYRKGQAWYEPPGLVHQLTKNPDNDKRTLFLAVIIGQEGKPSKLPIT
jgi:quercetin dioxygenase-like cupin family protein